CHLRCLRADAISRSGSITAEIWRHVNEAMCVIADLSGRNANVFYEIGLAHALGKPVVLLSRDASDVPFDLRHLRIVQYDHGAGLKAIRSQLLSAIRSCFTTLPQRWDQPRRAEEQNSLVRISGLSSVRKGETRQMIVWDTIRDKVYKHLDPATLFATPKTE